MKYPMKLKTENPLFEYMVMDAMNFDYYLFDGFDDALKCAQTTSVEGDRLFFIYEPYFNTQTREWHGQPTFRARGGKMSYDKFESPALHLCFYLNLGEWKNPRKDWIEIIKCKEKDGAKGGEDT